MHQLIVKYKYLIQKTESVYLSFGYSGGGEKNCTLSARKHSISAGLS